MNVTIIGTGKMGRGLSIRFLEGGHNITLVGHTPGKAEALVNELKQMGKGGSISVAPADTLPGEVVILAVPYGVAESVVHQYIESLPGMILVDITNPVKFQEMELAISPDTSMAEEIAKIAPVNTRVIKAFNTIFAKTLPTGKVEGKSLYIFIAGDDADAKAKLVQLIESGGMHAIDTGPLPRARQLEALGLLHMAIQNTNKLGFQSAIKILS